MICEICGKREAYFKVEIEGAEISTCKVCSRGAKILGTLKEETFQEKLEAKPEVGEEEEIVENYGEIIKKARMKKGLSLEELAKKINERESYLRHVEREEMLPNDALIKKLEKELNIKLKESVPISSLHVKTEKKEEETLGDIAEIEGELDGS